MLYFKFVHVVGTVNCTFFVPNTRSTYIGTYVPKYILECLPTYTYVLIRSYLNVRYHCPSQCTYGDIRKSFDVVRSFSQNGKVFCKYKYCSRGLSAFFNEKDEFKVKLNKRAKPRLQATERKRIIIINILKDGRVAD